MARGPAVGRRKKRRTWQLDGGTRCRRRARGYDYCIVAGWVAHGADLRALGGPAEEKKNAGAGWVACGKDLWAREGPRDRNPRTLVCLFPKQETFGVPCLKNGAEHGGWMACGLAGCRRRLDRQRRLDGLCAVGAGGLRSLDGGLSEWRAINLPAQGRAQNASIFSFNPTPYTQNPARLRHEIKVLPV